jgi:Transposase IS4
LACTHWQYEKTIGGFTNLVNLWAKIALNKSIIFSALMMKTLLPRPQMPSGFIEYSVYLILFALSVKLLGMPRVYKLVVCHDIVRCIILSFWRSGPTRQYGTPVTQTAYYSSSYIAINEAMVACQGCLKHTVKLKGKPIHTGYKIWCISDHGYIWSWLFHLRI